MYQNEFDENYMDQLTDELWPVQFGGPGMPPPPFGPGGPGMPPPGGGPGGPGMPPPPFGPGGPGMPPPGGGPGGPGMPPPPFGPGGPGMPPPGGGPGGPPMSPGGPGAAPMAPPPSFTPMMSSSQYGSQGIRQCTYRNTFIWLRNGQNFWFFPTFVSSNVVLGFRWGRFGWVFNTVNRNNILTFQCF